MLAQDRAERDAPIRDDAQRVVPGAQGLQSGQHVGIDLPACMLLKLLIDGPSELVEARLIVFRDEGTQNSHIVADPEFVDSLIVGPGISVFAGLAQEVVLSRVHALLYMGKIDMEIELAADVLADLGR